MIKAVLIINQYHTYHIYIIISSCSLMIMRDLNHLYVYYIDYNHYIHAYGVWLVLIWWLDLGVRGAYMYILCPYPSTYHSFSKGETNNRITSHPPARSISKVGWYNPTHLPEKITVAGSNILHTEYKCSRGTPT